MNINRSIVGACFLTVHFHYFFGGIENLNRIQTVDFDKNEANFMLGSCIFEGIDYIVAEISIFPKSDDNQDDDNNTGCYIVIFSVFCIIFHF